MDEQKNAGTGDQQGRHTPAKVWMPIVISALALVISTLGFIVQQRALDQQREQIAAQNDQLETQRNQLDIQRDALEAQQKEFQAAEDRWKSEGPLFRARGYLRQDPELALALLDFSEDSSAPTPNDELQQVHVNEVQAELGPIYIEAEVTNVGRSAGLIANVSGDLFGYAKESSLSELPGIWICRSAIGKVGDPSPTACTGHFVKDDVICLGADGKETVCQFPLQVPQQTSIRLRFKLTDYFAQNLMCKGGSLPGRVELTIRPASGPHLKSAFFASNWRGCPEGPGTFRIPPPVPFK